VKQPADKVTVDRPVSGPSKNTTTYPLISIVVPTFNRSEYLKDAIESALSQKYDNYEVVIVDDGSTDNTAQIIQPFDQSLIYVPLPHRGQPAATRNAGLRVATGEFVAFLVEHVSFVAERFAIWLSSLRFSMRLWYFFTFRE
jgi:glycosyltransferase involved in cell wall biosynthesis